MVHAVQAPERGHGMEDHVLEVDGQIECQHRHHERQPVRHVDGVEEAPPVLGREDRERHRHHGKRQANQDGVDHDDAEIVRPADQPRDFAPSPRRGHFPHGHRDQDAEENPQPDRRFVGQEDVGHCALLR